MPDHRRALYELRAQQIELLRDIANDPTISHRTRAEAWDHIMQLMNQQLRDLERA